MSRGNYLPEQHIQEGYYEMVYIDMPDSESDFDLGFFEHDLLEDVYDLLPGSFEREGTAWAWSNKHVHIELTTDEIYYPLVVCPKGRFDDPRSNQGMGYIPGISQILFDGLLEKGYRLYKRTGPYTSAPYEASEPVKTWNFHITLVGSGKTEEKAWNNAVEMTNLEEADYDYSEIEFEEEE